MAWGGEREGGEKEGRKGGEMEGGREGGREREKVKTHATVQSESLCSACEKKNK